MGDSEEAFGVAIIIVGLEWLFAFLIGGWYWLFHPHWDGTLYVQYLIMISFTSGVVMFFVASIWD